MKILRRRVQKDQLTEHYVFQYYHKRIEEDKIFFESRNSSDFTGNVLKLARELATGEYGNFRFFISIKQEKMKYAKAFLNRYHIPGKLVLYDSKEYYTCLATAKYLITDTSFAYRFTKREGQIIINTWHGTPLKNMGRDINNSNGYFFGNVKRSLMISDYLLYQSEFMREKMMQAYDMESLYRGKVLLSGYPRNEVFFDKKRRNEVRKELKIDDKKVYVYMPTWRENVTVRGRKQTTDHVIYYLQQIDQQLQDDECFYLRLHPLLGTCIDVSLYKHIRVFPSGYEAYDLLNTADCIVTDYSSVFFDFANTGRKIVLFAYDKEAYLKYRGLYMPFESLPFPMVRNVEGLIQELRSPKEYDDKEFMARYLDFDGAHVAKNVCNHIFLQKNSCKELDYSKINIKENVLFFAGDFAMNGITTSINTLMSYIDTDKRNYQMTYDTSSIQKNPKRLGDIPRTVGLFPMQGGMYPTAKEQNALDDFFLRNKNTKDILKLVERYYKRECIRFFGFNSFDTVIQFHGYYAKYIQMFMNMDAKRIIYVHSNMVQEMASRSNQHELSLRMAYKNYDAVATVSEGIVPPTIELGAPKEHIHVVENCNNHHRIQERAKLPIEFDKFTISTHTEEQVEEILATDSVKLINIGRFSMEKGHDMLIEAFEKFYHHNQNSYLLIIGGHGAAYPALMKTISGLDSKEHIVIIQHVANPMPILAKCSMFILSSRYEGLGLVLLEAMALGVPVTSTDITGPRLFMKRYNGRLVDCSSQGLLESMMEFEAGKIPPVDIDFDKYNAHAVETFEGLFKEAE